MWSLFLHKEVVIKTTSGIFVFVFLYRTCPFRACVCEKGLKINTLYTVGIQKVNERKRIERKIYKNNDMFAAQEENNQKTRPTNAFAKSHPSSRKQGIRSTTEP